MTEGEFEVRAARRNAMLYKNVQALKHEATDPRTLQSMLFVLSQELKTFPQDRRVGFEVTDVSTDYGDTYTVMEMWTL